MKQLQLITSIFIAIFLLSSCARSPLRQEKDELASPTSEVTPPELASPTETTPTPINEDGSVQVTDASTSIEDVSKSPLSYIDKKYNDNKNATTSAMSAQTTLNKEDSNDDSENTVNKTATTQTLDSETNDQILLKKPFVAPEKALIYLKHGNQRFLKGTLRKDGQSKKDVRRLAKKQKPFAVIFTTSDSRVSPEIIFDEKLGEIFVVRNFGLSVDDSVINSLEYAVRYLRVGLIVVMDRNYSDGSSTNHVHDVIKKILATSTMLQSYNSANDLKIISAVYHLENGKVAFGN